MTRAAGGDWKASKDFIDAIAPTGDLMSWLAGLRNVQTLGTERKAAPSGLPNFLSGQ